MKKFMAIWSVGWTSLITQYKCIDFENIYSVLSKSWEIKSRYFALMLKCENHCPGDGADFRSLYFE